MYHNKILFPQVSLVDGDAGTVSDARGSQLEGRCGRLCSIALSFCACVCVCVLGGRGMCVCVLGGAGLSECTCTYCMHLPVIICAGK